MAKQAFRVGSKVKVKVDGTWVLARIALVETGLATLERLDQEKGVPPEHRTVYARVTDLRPAKTAETAQPQPEGEQP